MKENVLRKMLEAAGRDLKAAKEKYDEIERKLAFPRKTDFYLHFTGKQWKPSFDDIIVSYNGIETVIEKLGNPNRNKISNLTAMVQRHKFSVGDVVCLPYFDDSILKNEGCLETMLPFNVCRVFNDKIMLHCRFAIGSYIFDSVDSNDYKNSNIRDMLDSLDDSFDDALSSHFKPQELKCIDAIKEKFYFLSDKFWLLNIDELFTFYPEMEDRKRKYLSDGSAANWWLRYPHTGISYYEYFVLTSGASSNSNTSISYGCVPACILG